MTVCTILRVDGAEWGCIDAWVPTTLGMGLTVGGCLHGRCCRAYHTEHVPLAFLEQPVSVALAYEGKQLSGGGLRIVCGHCARAS